jgi:hypothetical protein
MTESLNPPLSDYSTQAARADEMRRRKLRRELLAQWQALHTALDKESVEAIRGISDEEWAAAQAKDDGAANG